MSGDKRPDFDKYLNIYEPYPGDNPDNQFFDSTYWISGTPGALFRLAKDPGALTESAPTFEFPKRVNYKQESCEWIFGQFMDDLPSNIVPEIPEQPAAKQKHMDDAAEEDDREHLDDFEALPKTIEHCLEGFKVEGRPRVLSVGTGMGALGEHVAFLGFFLQEFDYTAVEPDAEALSNQAHYLMSHDAILLPMDARRMPVGEYDVIFMAHPMHDCGDESLRLWQEIFDHVTPMLVEGGRFVTTHYCKRGEILMHQEFDRLGLKTIISGENPNPGTQFTGKAGVYSYISVAEK